MEWHERCNTAPSSTNYPCLVIKGKRNLTEEMALRFTLELSLDAACDGDPETREWPVPLTEAPRGINCEFAAPQGLGATRKEAFLWCAADGSCNAGLTCVPEGEGVGRCLPACSVDADCPLPGGTLCEAGHCVPNASP